MAATLDLQSSTVVKAIKAPEWPLYSWRTKSPNARLIYTRDVDEANAELSKLEPGPLGLDMEWKPCFYAGEPENPVALVQLANDEVVLLIQVSAMTTFPEKLREVLGSSLYVKAGVAIKGDCMKIYRDFSLICRNCVDLSLLARTVDNDRWKGGYRQSIGLNRLCEAYEELSLVKGKITRSNWELMLSEAQQEYAANDSHSGYALYRRLAAMANAMSSAP
ncbi:ribonuclease H-like domain-containing protein, partial [Fomitopsis serialis]|uniref:ribonuclease H-like domain-containing protein n=1 Tax=Fomitopsis serialis TaxID=139415 RepID=UPI00200805EF